MVFGAVPSAFAAEEEKLIDGLSDEEISEIIEDIAMQPFMAEENETLPGALDEAETGESDKVSDTAAEDGAETGEPEKASDTAEEESPDTDERLFSAENTETKFTPWKMIYAPDYSDGVIDCHTDCVSGYEGCDIFEQNNMLNITMYNFLGSGIRVSPVAPNVQIKQDCVIEYTISRTLFEAQILDRIGTPEYGVGVTDIQVHPYGSSLVAYRTSTDPDADRSRKSVGGVGDNNNIRFVIFARFSTGKMDIYINDRLVVDDKYMRDNMTGFSTINLYYNCDYAKTKCAVKDMKVYLVDDGGLSDEERVKADADALTFKGLWREGGAEVNGMYSGNLCLYNIAGNGSDVTWSCSDPSIVSESGIVTCDRPQKVTLTATFTSGGAQVSKDIEFTPLPTAIDINEMPQAEEYIYENDFETGGELPYEISVNDYATGDVSISDGQLCMDRGETGYSGPTAYMWTKDRKPVKGLIGVEFDWAKESGIGSWIRSGPIFFYWRSDNALILQTCRDPESTNVLATNAGRYSDPVHVQFVYDTNTSRISCWVNGVCRLSNSYSRLAAQSTFSNIYMWISEGTGKQYIDNLKMYYAIPTALERLAYEAEALTYEDLLTKPFVDGNIIDCDYLNLPDTARYGSSVTWTSDNPEAIDELGRVNREGWSENPAVTLTATIDCMGLTKQKEFTFVVLRDIGGGDAGLADMQDLNESMLIDKNDTDKNNVTLALRLMPYGIRGTKIMWYSDNPQVISTSGRVVRPKMGDGDAEVTLTADFGGGRRKELHFTVKEDYYYDKQWHADEDFFGLWKNGEWEKQPRINYSYKNDQNLALAEDAAKNGDYQACKAHILDYWRTRKKTSSSTSRFPLATKIAQGHIYHENEVTSIDVGAGVVASHDYEKVEIDLANKQLFADSAALGFSIMSLYSENSTVSILSREYANGEYAPKLQLVVNGVIKTYDVSEDLTIRAGKYEGECYGKDDILKVRLFGDFLGDESQRTLMRFNYDYITGSKDTVDSAKLILYAKVDEDYVESKNIALCVDKSSFNEDSSWNSLTGFLYQWDGMPGKNTWALTRYASSEYLSQSCRFLYRGPMMAEYSYTKDEEYAYFLISEAMDFLMDQGMERTYSGNTGAGTSRSLYGNYLACAVRQGFYPLITSDIIDSKYMTPEVFGTLLKSAWDFEDVIYRTNLGTDMVNWGVIYYRALMQAASAVPEFIFSDDVFDKAVEKLESFMLETTFEDGSYKEASTMYSISTLGTYRLIKQALREYGSDTSKKYDERLRKAGLYCILLNGPRYTRWGDSGMSDSGGIPSNLYDPYVQFFNDYEMQYIGTFGAKGVKPSWTSKMFKENMTCFMRSDWSRNQTFMFVNSRGPSNHAHCDDNHIFLSAKDRTLLTDQGVGTYDVGNAQRKWLTSTIAHNTVEINNTQQTGSGKTGDYGLQGILHDWSTSSAFDFLSQSTISYREHDHRRSITFIKPEFIIVSDRITPNDLSSENTYKQAWHTPVAGNLTVDTENNLSKTNFAAGANLFIASTVGEAKAVKSTGFYDYGAGQVGEVPFVYYELENVKGAREIDTVLLPYEGTNVNLTVERLEKDVNPAEVSTLKISSDKDGIKETTYYALNYKGGEAAFGEYVTDAFMAAVTLDENGKVSSVAMDNGSYIKKKSGEYVLKYSDKIANLSYSVVGDTAAATVGDEIEFNTSDIGIYSDNRLTTVKVNDKNQYFVQNGTEVSFSGGTYDDEFKKDNNSGGGIVDKDTGSPGGSSGKGPGGSPTVPGTSPTVPGNTPNVPGGESGQHRFNDTLNHWAEKTIDEMADKNVVDGYPDGSFRPDCLITRAEFVKMIYNAVYGKADAVYSGTFKDVASDDWYASFVEAALEKNIISKDILFRPSDNITRQEICKIAESILGNALYEKPADFTDKELISDWALPYVSAAYEDGIVTGYDDGSFRPLGEATRAEAAIVINRVMQKQNN